MGYQRKGVWYTRVTINGRMVRKALPGCTNGKTAKAIEAKMKADALEGKYYNVKKNANITFREFSEVYLSKHSKTNKISYYEDCCRMKKLVQFFGEFQFSDIKPFDIEEFKSVRMLDDSPSRPGEKISPTTVNHDLKLLSSMFSRAVAWKMLVTENPMKEVKQLRENNHRLRFLSVEEIGELSKACVNDEERGVKGELFNLVTLAVNTGMRKGELMGLEWHNIDLKNSAIHIYASKSGKPRPIPINKQAMEVLLSIRKLPCSSKLFESDHRQAYILALEAAGIKDANFHTLRHTFASHFMMCGGNIYALAKILGHSNIKMTERYSHLSPDFLTRTMETVGERLSTCAHKMHKSSTSENDAQVEGLEVTNFEGVA